MRSKVFISGAAGGLGKAFAVECARRGWDLYLTDLDQAQLDELAVGLSRTYDVDVVTKACDLMDSESREGIFKQIQGSDFRFRGLINVAGLDVEGIFQDRTRREVRGIVRLNVEGTLEVTHSLLDKTDPLSGFWIIMVSSLAAFFPIPVKATYAASKRFLLDFSLALRDELRPRGVTVTTLCPAGLPTTQSALEGIEAQGLLGQLTTRNVGYVARLTVDKALEGRSIVVPGFINQVMRLAGGLVPSVWLSSLLGRRWKNARKDRLDLAPDEYRMPKMTRV